MSDPASFQKRLIKSIEALRGGNGPRTRDSQYRSSTGYNLAEWADRGYAEAEKIVRDARPVPGEDLSSTILRLLNEARERYSQNDADEDGGGAGAVVDAIRALRAELGRDSG